MIEIAVSRASAKALEEQLAALKGEKVYAAMSQAAKRAASIKAATSIRMVQDGAVLRIAGPRKSAGHYKAKKRKQGIFLSVKKGSGDIVPRSFAYSNTFFKRKEGVPRLPIARIFGPAVPQLFGNDAIKNEIADAAMKKYEERIRHEVGRLIG